MCDHCHSMFVMFVHHAQSYIDKIKTSTDTHVTSSLAHNIDFPVSLACHQCRVFQKPVNANSGLKLTEVSILLVLDCFRFLFYMQFEVTQPSNSGKNNLNRKILTVKIQKCNQNAR